MPLIPQIITLDNGTECVLYWWDPDYEPPLPVGAVRGDITKQNFCNETPWYFYEDKVCTCIQCRRGFVFSAREQKHWYETLGFHQWSQAVRCRECRRQRRSEASTYAAVSLAKAAAKSNPESPLAHLAVAESVFELKARYGAGRLDDAIAAARLAARLEPGLHEALYWEAECHRLAGRVEKARELFTRFVEHAAGVPRCRTLHEKAKRRLQDSE